MRRFALVAVVWLVCIGSVGGYMHLRDKAHPPAATRAAVLPGQSTDHYDLEVTLTFSTQPDPFALDGEESRTGTVRLNNKHVADLTADILPGIPWIRRDINGVVTGTNELLVTATPPLADAPGSHAVRVRLWRNNQPVAEKTFWSEGGATIVGTLLFNVSSDEEEHSHE